MDQHTRLTVATVGAGRGSTKMQPRLAEYGRTSGVSLRQLLIDPLPGKSMALAVRGAELGLETVPVVARGEEYLKSVGDDGSAIVVAIDHGGDVARILLVSAGSPVIIHLFVDTAGRVTAWRCVLMPEDLKSREDAVALFEKLDAVSMRAGTQDVFGAKAPASNRIGEERYRAWFADHLTRNLGKVSQGLRPESSPIEMTFDGRLTNQVVVLKARRKWRSEEQILSDVMSQLNDPLRPGSGFVAAELGHDGLRVHRVRYRAMDKRFAVVPGRVAQEDVQRASPSEPRTRQTPVPEFALAKKLAAILAD